jgi:DNA-binding MarR family transcriptional regulator
MDFGGEERGEVFALTTSTSFLLTRALQLASDDFAGRGHPVTLRLFYVLAAIAKNPGRSQNDLVGITSVDRSTLADMLKRLVTLGLIGKAQSPNDARANLVELTPLGTRLVADASEDAAAADRAVLDLLSENQGERLQKLLERLNDRIDKLEEKAREEEKRQKRRDKKLSERMKRRAKKDQERAERKVARIKA